jgi:hypothetical protein
MSAQHKGRGKRLICILLGITSVVSALAFWLCCAAPVEGLYYNKYISGATYWQFKDGKVTLKTPEQHIDTGLTYARVGNQWIIRARAELHQPEVVLKPGPFGIRMICTEKDSQQWNRFYPRRGFSWLDSSGPYQPDRGDRKILK